jgi:4-hydroxyproline epimerase
MSRTAFSCIDAHTCGNPVRVVTAGGPSLEGSSMNERRLHFMREFDWIRTGLMFEPRGHDMMSGSILYPATSAENDIGLLFIETSGCLPMCGHGTIGTVTVMIEEGLVRPKTPGLLRLEVPAGAVEARYIMDGPHVTAVQLRNVPSFLHSANLRVECPGLGPIAVDVAYGGNFYAIVEPQERYRDMDQLSVDEMLRISPGLRRSLNESYTFIHPLNPTIRGLSHIQWTGAPKHPDAHARNAVFYGDRAIDRSPCGTGTSARMAQLTAKGKLKVGDTFTHESIIGSLFRGKVDAATSVGPYDAIIPMIEGWAHITGHNTIFIDDRDPYRHGFQVK